MAKRSPASEALDEARRALGEVDIDQPAEALPLLRTAVERLTDAIDESMAAMVLDEQGTLRAAGSLAGLSENAVGPRLARTERLAAYSNAGRVTARGVERAMYDEELGRKPATTPEEQRPPMRFKPRRSGSG